MSVADSKDSRACSADKLLREIALGLLEMRIKPGEFLVSGKSVDTSQLFEWAGRLRPSALRTLPIDFRAEPRERRQKIVKTARRQTRRQLLALPRACALISPRRVAS
jgi:hypothetical protein